MPTLSIAARAGLDDLIGAIYDCVIDPSRWHDTLDAIRRRYGFFNAMLSVVGTFSNDTVLSVSVNVPHDMLAIASALGEHIGELWGGWAQIAAAPLEEPLLNSEVTTRETWAGNPYFEGFVAPQGLDDAVAIVLARDSHTVATLAFGRHMSAPPLTEAEFDELRILAPHLRRAIAIGRMLETSASLAHSFAQALDASSAGVVLVDRRRRVVHANKVGRAMLEAGDPIHDNGGQIKLPGEVVPGAFLKAIDKAGETFASGKGAGIPARRRDGTPLTVQVFPLEHRVGSNTPRHAVAAVLIADSASGPPTSAEVLSLLFDLTPAETRVFLLIVEGLDLPEIAAQLSISRATAKTHLGRIYTKTGKNNRVDLARLAQAIALPGAS